MKSAPFIAIVASLLLTAIASADDNAFTPPTYQGPLNAAEKAFVAGIQSDLPKRFATSADAEKAGYVRYTDEDDTGAISYANRQWQSADAKHPSQLWYGKDGRLLGADFSVLKTAQPPDRWGINPGRWWQMPKHIHWVSRDPSTGTLTYDQWVTDDNWLAAGGSVTDPKPDTLVTLGKVKSASDVVTLFHFPAVWDLVVWVKPNPSGAFANKNPLVTP